MTSLQLGLIVAGAALVGGVYIYNLMQERRIRRQIDEAFRQTGKQGAAPADVDAGIPGRIEPTLPGAIPENAPRTRAADASADEDYEPPLAIQNRIATDLATEDHAVAPPVLSETRTSIADRNMPQPDPDIECIVALQPEKPVSAGALAAGLHARLGRPLRWFGRRGPGLPWQLLKSDTGGDFSEVIGCLLLANRAGAASRPLLESYFKMVADIASGLPSPFIAPDAAAEAARAEALDRICADLDVQIGLTLLKTEATIAGTRLRGVAEASGFRLADDGRFDWIQEDTGAVLYSLQNYRSEPFTLETLRSMATPGAVFVLDVPRVGDPVRVYDQMKMTAKRVAHSLDAILVDDNRRPLDDAALNAIRDQVRETATSLSEVRIEPGSARALALFGG